MNLTKNNILMNDIQDRFRLGKLNLPTYVAIIVFFTVLWLVVNSPLLSQWHKLISQEILVIVAIIFAIASCVLGLVLLIWCLIRISELLEGRYYFYLAQAIVIGLVALTLPFWLPFLAMALSGGVF